MPGKNIKSNRRGFSRTADKTVGTTTGIEPLESRLLMAVNSWKTAVSGDWNTAANWSLGHVPNSTEDVQINLAGSYSVTHATAAADSVKSITSVRPFDLSAGSINVAGAVTISNTFTISGGKLIHATINGTGPTFSTLNSILDGVTLNADAVLTNAAVVTVMHGLTLQNNHVVSLQSSGAFTRFVFDCTAVAGGSQTLGGTGRVVFAGTSPKNNQFNVTNSGGSLTIASGITVRGPAGHFGAGGGPAFIINQGTIQADTAGGQLIFDASALLNNQGTMIASNGGELQLNCPTSNAAGKTMSALTGGILSLNGLNWTNAGTIVENASVVNLGGTFNNPGTITRTAGTINLTGTNDRAGGALTLTATTGNWNFKGGTVKNASITFSGGSLVPVAVNFLGNIFDKCTLNSDLVIPDGTSVNIRNGLNITANHIITLSGSTKSTTLGFLNQSASQTLGGSGQVVFGGSSATLNEIRADTGTTTFGSGILIHGKGGTLTTSTNASAKFTNQGLLLADTAGQTISILGNGTFTNNGNLMAAPGTIVIASPYVFGATGQTTVGIGGTVAGSSYGVLNFTKPVTLAGVLNTVLINNFTPANLAVFTAIKYTSFIGAFATLNLLAGNGIGFTAALNPTNIIFTAHTGATSVASRAGGVLTFNGTAAADTMSVDDKLGVVTCKIGATTAVFASSLVTSIKISGGDNNDTITYNAVPIGASLGSPSTISGGNGDDKINGSALKDSIAGDAGNDSIVGNSGDDILTGGAGNDTQIGGGGNDTYLFTDATLAETDLIGENAGGGTDTLDFSAITSIITGKLNNDTLATMTNRTVKTQIAGTFVNLENFFGGTNNDNITGNSAKNIIKGNNGNDTINVAGDLGKIDNVDGGAGTDTVTKDADDILTNVP